MYLRFIHKNRFFRLSPRTNFHPLGVNITSTEDWCSWGYPGAWALRWEEDFSLPALWTIRILNHVNFEPYFFLIWKFKFLWHLPRQLRCLPLSLAVLTWLLFVVGFLVSGWCHLPLSWVSGEQGPRVYHSPSTQPHPINVCWMTEWVSQDFGWAERNPPT